MICNKIFSIESKRLPLSTNSSKEPDDPESWPLPPYTFNWKNGNKMVKGNFHGNRIDKFLQSQLKDLSRTENCDHAI